MAELFHIAEWYGRPFLEISETDRVRLAEHKVGSANMKKADAERLTALRTKASTDELSARESARLAELEAKLLHQQASEQTCPFRTDIEHPTCTKPGGVCSLRLYSDQNGVITPVDGERGMIRALCPKRFHDADTAYKYIGAKLLSDPSPKHVGEVGFLKSTGNLDSAEGEHVGRIDMILVKSNAPAGFPIDWCAVELQAVYFSGREMSIEFKHIIETKGAVGMPREGRRPDYRSSGPKRLMPQLQIKVPTLRRWGKKMAVVVDLPFFLSMGKMETVSDVSNCDIVWFLVDFQRPEGADRYHLKVIDEVYVTLERAIEGLTGGVPVSLNEFEVRVKSQGWPATSLPD